jgi:FecR protein
MTNPQRSLAIVLTAWLALSVLCPGRAWADEGDPPTRVARLAYAEGSVSFQPAGTEDWVAPPINRPLTTGDQLWSDQGSRAELQLDGSSVRLSAGTAVSLLNLSNTVTQIQLSVGTVLLHVRRLDDDETYEIDTPNLAFSVLRPGLYRITVDGSGNTTSVLIRRGQGEATGGGVAYPVGQGESDVFSGTNQLAENAQPYSPDQDAFEAWAADRDARWDHSVSARFVSPDVIGYEDLDDQGTWTPDPQYGNVWYPRAVESGWAPYQYGHWAYVAPWGYTWVDDSPWGFAPFHYGRWVSVRGAWGWIPAPPPPPGAVYVRPVYAPALVAWVGIGAGVAWFALGPREVYVPSYPVSRRYVDNINVSNTTVNTTIINNVYNTTVINKTVVNNITYVNRNVPGAVVATTSQAFTSAQPVARNVVHVNQGAIAATSVAARAPAIVPTRQSVLGGGRSSSMKPPAAIQTRTVIARTAPPAPPPAFERRQEAIKGNGGIPLSAAQVRQISTGAPERAAVKIAPPPRMVAPARAAEPPAAIRPNAERSESHTPPLPAQAPRSAANAIHPNELPPQPKPASPAVANSVLERQHLQEQQRLQAQQEADRQRLQQQQDTEHQRAAKEAADKAAHQQQLEQEHQAQTQQLARQHAQEQQQLQARQQEQKRRQQEGPTAPKASKDDRPPPPHKP